MPKVDNVGYGKFSAHKMAILRSIFDMHLAITQAVLKKHPAYRQLYKYIDATSGKGYVPESSLPGSPLVFLDAMHHKQFDMACEVNLIEQEDVNFAALQTNVSDYCTNSNIDLKTLVQFYLGSYENVLTPLLGNENNRELGLVFIDPSGDLPAVDAVTLASKLRPRMDVLLYLSARNIKRIHHLTNKSLLDYMQEISKSNWLIRKPDKFDNLEWTFLLGSNADIFKDYKKIDFYRLESAEAQKFFPKLNLTSKERMEKLQPRLF